MEYQRTATETKALLAWISNSELVEETVPTTEEVSDGKVIWEILQHIDADKLGDIPYTDTYDNWEHKKVNLDKIYDFLVQYFEERSSGIPNGLGEKPDLEKVATNTSARDTNKLLKLVLIAVLVAIQSAAVQPSEGDPARDEIREELNRKLKSSIENLDHRYSNQLKNIIEESETKKPWLDDGPLKFEEHLFKLIEENDRLMRDVADLNQLVTKKEQALSRAEDVIKDHETKEKTLKDRIENLRSGKGNYESGTQRLHQQERSRLEVKIADLEEALGSVEKKNNELEKEVQTLRVVKDNYTDLKSEYEAMKKDHIKLRNQAEAGIKWRAKVEDLQRVAKENESLKKENEQLKEDLKNGDLKIRFMAEQQKGLENISKALSQSEQDLHESRNMRQVLEIQNAQLENRVRSLEEGMNRLRGGTGESEDTSYEFDGSNRSPTPPTGTMTPNLSGNLQQDLEALGLGESTLSLGVEDKPEITDQAGSVKGELDGTMDEHILAMQDEDKAKLIQEMLKPVEDAKERLAKFITSQTGEGSEALQQSLEDLTKQISELIEKDHERLAQRAQYIHQQNEQIKSLRDRISQLEEEAEEAKASDGDGDGEDAISKERELELQKQIDSLSRELALMSSSWYELQGKLHNTNNVPISRYRHGSAGLVDAQKGWLARQRSAVAGR
ncbi:hypothetical protein BJX65DRAFT_286498 [Aspergillus insuetus]